MTVTQATIEESGNFQLANAAPYTGSDVFGLGADVQERWGTGTGDRQFDKGAEFTFTIPALGTQLIDLQTDLGADGAALALVECRYLKIQADEANTSLVTVEPDATNGWTSWLAAAGDILNIPAGMTVGFVAPLDGSLVVGGTNKELLITNTDAANAATVRVVVVGTSA